MPHLLVALALTFAPVTAPLDRGDRGERARCDYADCEDDSGDGSGDCAGAEHCSDDDFSPGAIIICLEPGSCRFDGE